MGSVQTMKMRTLYDTFRDYKDPKGRLLSVIFSKLPSKNVRIVLYVYIFPCFECFSNFNQLVHGILQEYPDYYEVIKRPIDLDKISQKLRTNVYESLEEVAQDLILMCDNACKYNEPDSQIYKVQPIYFFLSINNAV